ncbi:bublin coiled-coil protein [Odontesthes bonariensis]|uniref:bublin coiled-coil protein n=1 Tax=Odontesthes bonariensis TaxID=219752 RepID=UPI003F587C4F
MSGPNGDPSMSTDDGIINDEDEFGNEEYADINSMLDQINSYLDDLEERNDALNGKMHDLLESNRQARLEFRSQLLGSSTQEERHPAEEESSLPSKEDLNKENGGS